MMFITPKLPYLRFLLLFPHATESFGSSSAEMASGLNQPWKALLSNNSSDPAQTSSQGDADPVHKPSTIAVGPPPGLAVWSINKIYRYGPANSILLLARIEMIRRPYD